MIDRTFIFSSFITLFLIVDPMGNIPLFLALTQDFSRADQVYIIRRAVGIAFVSLSLFMVAGEAIFKALGVEMHSFQIAGGILLFIIAIEMLFGRKTRTQTSGEEMEERRSREELAVTPLAIPLLTGPGAITAGVVLYSLAPDTFHRALLMLIILSVFLITYLLILKAREVFQLLGRTGTTVVIRIMGLILAAIAVQFIISGVEMAIAAMT